MITITLWIPAAIAGATAITSAIISNSAKKKAARRQREQNLADEMSRREYNSPKAQMDRFANANLNPNLIYSQGNAGNTEGTESSEVFQSDLGENINNAAGSTIGQFYNFQKHKAGMDKIEQETRKLNQDNDFDSANYIVKLRHLSQNAKNQADKLFYDAQIRQMEKKTLSEQRKAWSSGTMEVQEDGSMGLKKHAIISLGQSKAIEQIQNINTKADATKLIQAQTTNQALANKRIKEFEKILEKIKQDGNISIQDALQAAAYFIITK